jgi:hypothetical protein
MGNEKSRPARSDSELGDVHVALTAAEWKHVGPILNWLRAQLDVALPTLPAKQPTKFAMTERLADSFGLQLRIFHALHGSHEALSKKSFEFALESAANDAGFEASIDENTTTPGADIVINGEGFSVKTEAGRSISSEVVFLTKLMESAWTKNLKEPAQFVEGIHKNVLPRVLQADRTLVWRCHNRFSDDNCQAEYELLEIPRAYWEAMATVKAEQFAPLSKAGSTSVPVLIDGKTIYTLSFDGSDQKIQVRNLDVEICNFLGRWWLHPPTV